MKKYKIIKKTAAIVLLMGILSSPAVAQSDGSVTAEQVRKAKDTGLTYAEDPNFAFAKKYLDEYAAGAASLAEAGVWHKSAVDMAQALADSYDYDPILSVETVGDKLFCGADGYALAGADAVRLNVPYGVANVEDYLGLIPKSEEELCVLVCFEMQDERSMISLYRGNDEARLENNLRQLSRIEGRVYLAFCPAVDTMKNTKTLHYNFIEAYRHVAKAARRFAPNAQLVYAVSDMPVPGEDTVAKFYPGDEYVDVFGVEVVSNYKLDPFWGIEELNWYARGDFYDPAYSVKRMEDYFRDSVGHDVPVMVTGVSFPWDGKYARQSWADDMRRFYGELTKVCPAAEAVFYSGKSSSGGRCNLRENPEAVRVLEECIKRINGNTVRLIPFADGMPIESPARLTVRLDGVFRDGSYLIRLDGQSATKETAFTEGEHLLEVFVTEDSFYSKTVYTASVDSDGKVSLSQAAPQIDYNGNGILDHGDVEILTAVVAKWQVDVGEIDSDVNGDGKTNIHDIVALGKLISP